MIALVFSKPEKKPDCDLSTWERWSQLPREQYWPAVKDYYEAKLKQLRTLPEPTAAKRQPRWRQKWERRKQEQKAD